MKRILSFITAILMILALASCSSSNGTDDPVEDTSQNGVASDENTAPDGFTGDYTAVIKIRNYGTITLSLDSGSAPETVENFAALAADGFYDGLTFHRIIKNFMIQGGDPLGTGMGGSEKKIPGEFKLNGYANNLKHTRGAISMARSSDYDSASSQFFIVHKDSPHLNGSYACFGYVTSGMSVVDKICEDANPTDNNGKIEKGDQPVIESITVTKTGK